MTITYNRVPPHMREEVQAYVETGRVPGDFLVAMLENNLVRVLQLADDINRMQLDQWALFLYHNAPALCWGSKEKVAAWVARRGMANETTN